MVQIILKYPASVFLLIYFAFQNVMAKPQILELVEPCEIKIENTTFNVPGFIKAENKDTKVAINICDIKTQQNIINCSTVCIYNKNNRKTEKSTNAPSFDLEYTDEVTLKLKNKVKCNNRQYYNITINMRSWTKQPTLTNADECNLQIEISDISSLSPCTLRLENGNLIDLRPLKFKPVNFQVKEKMYSISLCGNNANCGQDIVGCVKFNNTLDKLGTLRTQLVKYDMNSNAIKVTASYKEGSVRRLMEIFLKCNWDVNYTDNAKYIIPSIQGIKYKFEVDSSFGCVKTFQNCEVKDLDNNFIYDINNLFKSTGQKIELPSNDYILFNICGPLEYLPISCGKTHSQVCQIGKNGSKNKGSLPQPVHVIDKKFLRAIITNGDICMKNNTKVAHTTQIDIKCSSVEKPPVFVKEEDCTTHISWETREACPKMETIATKCIISTYLGAYYLDKLYSDSDKVHSLSNNKLLKYNVCGKIHSTCNNISNAGACLFDGKKEIILGYSNENATFSNGNVELKYVGDRCSSYDKLASVTFTFYCSYSNKPLSIVKEIEKDCTYAVTIKDSSACLNQEFQDCRVIENNLRYDLSPLASNNVNYVVTDPDDKNIKYFLNICTPLISGPNFYCPSSSMICKEDTYEPYIMKRFISLGSKNSPSIENGSLVIRSTLGFMCKPGVHYNSLIKFECSGQEDLQLKSKIECFYEFLWKTRHACSQSCIISGGNYSIDLSSSLKEFKINELDINLCKDTYRNCENGRCKEYNLYRNAFKFNNTVFLNITLNEKKYCSKPAEFNRIYIKLNCEYENNNWLGQISNIHNCLIILSMKTSAVCNTQELLKQLPAYNSIDSLLFNNAKPQPDNINSNIMNELISTNQFDKLFKEDRDNLINKSKPKPIDKQENINTKRNISVDQILPEVSFKKNAEYSCKPLQTLMLNIHPNTLVKSLVRSDNIYQVNFKEEYPNCRGLICKNNISILNISDSCRTENITSDITRYQFKTNRSCGRAEYFVTKINVRCNSNMEFLSVAQESECQAIFNYDTKVACKTSTVDAGMSYFVIGTLLLCGGISTLFSLAYIIRRKKRVQYNKVESGSLFKKIF